MGGGWGSLPGSVLLQGGLLPAWVGDDGEAGGLWLVMAVGGWWSVARFVEGGRACCCLVDEGLGWWGEPLANHPHPPPPLFRVQQPLVTAGPTMAPPAWPGPWQITVEL